MVRLTRLKDVRHRKALTQQQLADRAGVNRVTIARIEGGKDEPFPTTVRKVADALGVEPEVLSEPVVQARPSADLPDLASLFDDRFTIVGEADVQRMLQAEPELVPLIREAADQLSERFPDARFRLEYRVDPDYGEPEELFLGAITHMNVTEALEALRRFDREWLAHNDRRARGLLLVDVDPRGA
jgi:transcriptional regulator with XRE-family HTH domain